MSGKNPGMTLFEIASKELRLRFSILREGFPAEALEANSFDLSLRGSDHEHRKLDHAQRNRPTYRRQHVAALKKQGQVLRTAIAAYMQAKSVNDTDLSDAHCHEVLASCKRFDHLRAHAARTLNSTILARRKGGNATQLRIQPAREHARLLAQQTAPDEGWSSTRAAAEAIAPALAKFIRAEKIAIQVEGENFLRTIQRWLEHKNGWNSPDDPGECDLA